jgi:hypothetical protein
MALSSASRLLALTLLFLGVSCRRFYVCGDELPCAPPRGTGGAEGGAGGAGPECGGEYRDCDGTTLNRCETDVSSSVAHCGACEQPCHGACTSGTCVPFETAVRDRSYAEGNIVVTSESIFFAARRNRGTGPLSLERLSRAEGTTRVLAEGAWSSVQALAATSTRLYVLGDNTLWSLPLTGVELRDEAIDATALATTGAHLALESGGRVYLRPGDDGTPLPLVGVENARVIGGGPGAIAIARLRTTTPRSYELLVHDLSSGVTNELASGPGEVTALEMVDSDQIYYAVSPDPGFEDAVLYVAAEGSPPTALIPLPDVTKWTITRQLQSPFFGATCVISSFLRGPKHGLRFNAVSGPSYFVEWPTAGDPFGLATVGSAVFFFDGTRAELVSGDLDAMLAPEFLP